MSETKMSPLELEFLLRCYYSGKVEPVTPNELLMQEIIDKFLSADMIFKVGDKRGWSVTPKGLFFVMEILNHPFPIVEIKSGVAR